MNRFTMFAAASLVVAAPLAAAPTTHAPDYVKQAGAGDLFEKTSSQMVLKTAKDAKVRSFAQMMIDDHTKSTAQVVAAAKSDKVPAGAPKLMPPQVKMISQLKAAKGASMEKLYVTQQVTAHEQALALHTAFAQGGDKPALKQAATGIVPVVKSHLDELHGMQGSMTSGR